MFEGPTFDNPPKIKQGDIKYCLNYFRRQIDQVCEQIIFDYFDVSGHEFTCVMCIFNPKFYSVSKLDEHLHHHVEKTIRFYLKNYYKQMDY